MLHTREQLKQATHLRVIEAAGRLFRERGFTSTTVRDIAEASGVSAGTVMTVGDKNALLVRVFDLMIAAEHAERPGTDVPSSDAGSDPCVDRLADLVQPFVALFTSNLELARCYASILVAGAHTSSLFTDLAARLTGEFRAAITAHGCTAQPDAQASAGALYYAYVGTLFTWSAQGSADRAELSASLRATFAAICTCTEQPQCH